MAIIWEDLTEIADASLGKRYGRVVTRVAAAIQGDVVLPKTWVLEKKAFRRAMAEALPSGHKPLDVLGESTWSARRAKAARAHERMLGAVGGVPKVPWKKPPKRCLVWASPVLKPRELALPELCWAIAVPAEDVASAVCRLWAAVFFEHVLRGVSARASRVELAIGVTAAEPEDDARVLALLHEIFESRVQLLPLPGQAPLEAPLCEFDRTLFLRAAGSWRRALGQVGRSVPRGLFSGAVRRPGINPETALYVERSVNLVQLRGVVADLIGARSTSVAPELGDKPQRWVRLIARLLKQIAQHTELLQEVDQQEAEMEERAAWFGEMDLAILPDDGLRRTIEDLLEALDRASSAAARAAFSAAQHGRVYSALTGVEMTAFDAGLEVPTLEVLLQLEEVLRIVRKDDKLAEVLRGSHTQAESAARLDLAEQFKTAERFEATLPAGPGKRALMALSQRFPEILLTADGHLTPQLLSGVRVSLDEGREIESLVQEARVEADRHVAEREATVPRWAASSLAPLRSRAREAVLLRERARFLEVRLDGLLRRVALDIDRRLPRLDMGLKAGAVWHCRVDELVEAVDMRSHGLRSRAQWRAAEMEKCALAASPYLKLPEVNWDVDGADRLRRSIMPPSDRPHPSKMPPDRLWHSLEGRPLSLASARQLQDLPLLLHDEVIQSYAGRWTDTLPTTARALGVL